MSARLQRWGRARLHAFAAAIFGLLWFRYIAGGWSVLRPTNIDWLLVSDWGAHQLGWLFFRNDPWTFPIGHYTSLLYPIGSTLGYSDSIPVVGTVGKVFNAFLPADFQYIGPWLGACFVLQGYWGAKVAAVVCRDRWSAAIGGALFATAPTLLLRVQHPSLCAHWLLLAALYLHLRIAPGIRTIAGAFWLTCLSGSIHPYLAVMVLVLSLALLVRVKWIHPFLPWRHVAAMGAGFVAALGVVFWLFGYLGSGVNVKAGGFDYYAADLLTLFNPMGYSHEVPELPQAPGAYEGFAYLGSGLILLAMAAVVWVAPREIKRAEWRAVVPVLAGCSLLAILSFSSSIRIAGRDFIDLGWLYAKVPIIAEAFRSTGRFIWPLHYWVVTFALAVAASSIGKSPKALRGILLAVLAIQVLDMNSGHSRYRFKTSAFYRPTSPNWNVTRGDYDHLALYPPQVYGGECGVPFDELYVYRLDYIAYRLGLTTNSGYLARYSQALEEICLTSKRIETTGPDERTIYIASAGHPLPPGPFVCGQLDGYSACVSSQRPTRFSRALMATP